MLRSKAHVPARAPQRSKMLTNNAWSLIQGAEIAEVCVEVPAPGRVFAGADHQCVYGHLSDRWFRRGLVRVVFAVETDRTGWGGRTSSIQM